MSGFLYDFMTTAALDKYNESMHHVQMPSRLLCLENKLLTSLIYLKYCQAAEKGIHMEFQIKNPLCQSQVNEFQLVDAVGILLNNAIESSASGQTIYLCIDQHEQTPSGKSKKQMHITVCFKCITLINQTPQQSQLTVTNPSAYPQMNKHVTYVWILYYKKTATKLFCPKKLD